MGTRLWLLERRNGLPRGMCDRLGDDDRFSRWKLPSGAQWCLNSMISASGFPAYQKVFGSYPEDFFGWGDNDADLMFTQDTSLAGQFVQQWKLRMRPQEVSLEEVAYSTRRRLLSNNKSSNCADINVWRATVKALPVGWAPRRFCISMRPAWRPPLNVIRLKWFVFAYRNGSMKR